MPYHISDPDFLSKLLVAKAPHLTTIEAISSEVLRIPTLGPGLLIYLNKLNISVALSGKEAHVGVVIVQWN